MNMTDASTMMTTTTPPAMYRPVFDEFEDLAGTAELVDEALVVLIEDVVVPAELEPAVNREADDVVKLLGVVVAFPVVVSVEVDSVGTVVTLDETGVVDVAVVIVVIVVVVDTEVVVVRGSPITRGEPVSPETGMLPQTTPRVVLVAAVSEIVAA
jgi:hypothetical protein